MNGGLNAPAWRVAGASALGGFHAREGRPNQDAIAWTPTAAAGGVVAAVSDGHGAALHFRSERGARLAVEQALAILSRHLDANGPDEDALPQAVVTAWRQAVIADAVTDPLNGRGARPGAALAPYGATLLAMAATADALTLFQIGDGDLLFIYPAGRIARPFAPDRGLIGEQTYSLCMDDAEQRVHTASFWRDGIAWPAAVLLASDGVSKSFRDEAAFHAAARQLVAHAAADWAGFGRDLGQWLSAISHHGSGDDATLCLALGSGRGDQGHEERRLEPLSAAL